MTVPDRDRQAVAAATTITVPAHGSDTARGAFLARRLVGAARAYRRHLDRAGPLARVQRRLARARLVFWNWAAACDIRPGVRIGERLLILHPTGIVVHEISTIGDDCILMQQVTLGQLHETGGPRIGSGVLIGAGARVLGAIAVGDGARIGANAVVLDDVPPGATMVGVPALPHRRS